MHRVAVLAILGIVCGISSNTSLAQENAAPPKFSTSTNLVLVPVSVTDKKGQHISGLARDDFQLKQDGGVVPIATFEERMRKSPPVQPANDSQIAGKPQLVFTNQSASTRPETTVLIFAIDLVNTPILDLMSARKAILQFLLTQLREDQTIGIVTIEPGRVRLLHTFTTSTSVLSAALQRAIGVVSLPELPDFPSSALATETKGLKKFLEERDQTARINLAEEQARRLKSTMESLNQVGSWVAGIPGRKVLFWVVGTVPFTLVGPYNYDAYRTDLQKMADANIVIYPVDVRGLLAPGFSGSLQPRRSQVWDPIGSIDARSVQLQGARGFGDEHFVTNDVAQATAGQAFYNHNDIQQLFAKAEADTTDYYMVGYYLDPRHSAPGWHKLSVKVNRPEVKLRSRPGFFVPKSPADPDAVGKADEKLALLSPFEYTALPLSLAWKNVALVPENHKLKVNYALSLPPSAGLLGDGNRLDLDVIWQATGTDGNVAARDGQHFHATLQPNAVQQVSTAGVNYTNDLEIAPGEYAVRLVVRDNITGRIGSVTAPLQVRTLSPETQSWGPMPKTESK